MNLFSIPLKSLFIMPITRARQAELRTEALSIIWRVLDAKSTDIDLPRKGLSDEDVLFLAKIIDSKAQRAFNEYKDCKDRIRLRRLRNGQRRTQARDYGGVKHLDTPTQCEKHGFYSWSRGCPYCEHEVR